jgi:hypothetical protein
MCLIPRGFGKAIIIFNKSFLLVGLLPVSIDKAWEMLLRLPLLYIFRRSLKDSILPSIFLL